MSAVRHCYSPDAPQTERLAAYLEEKEARVERRKAFARRHAGETVVQLALNIPGRIKDSALLRRLLASGMSEFALRFPQLTECALTNASAGPSALFAAAEAPQSVKEKIAEVADVESVSFYRSRSYCDNVFYRNTAFNGAMYGVDSTYFDTAGYHVQAGRGFTEKEYTDNRKAVILDNIAVKSLFSGESPIGQVIDIQGEPFTIVGVVTESSAFEPVINSEEDYWTYMGSSGGKMFIPTNSWPIVYQYDEPENCLAKAADTDSMPAVGKKVADLMNATIRSTGSSDSEAKIQYKSEDLLGQAKSLQELSSSTNTMLIWIASISLLVGGIGVMNIMLVSVTERTREIGLKKAIGAKKHSILAQFLTEASVLTSIGGIIGVGIGIALAQLISRIASVPVAISSLSIVVSVVFSMVVGIVFGLIPSIKAANLNPIDALRYE